MAVMLEFHNFNDKKIWLRSLTFFMLWAFKFHCSKCNLLEIDKYILNLNSIRDVLILSLHIWSISSITTNVSSQSEIGNKKEKNLNISVN